MIYLIQLVKMWNKEEIELFVNLFDDLEYEIEELGYKGVEQDLIDDMMFNHFGITFEVDSQLAMFTNCILRHQGNIKGLVRGGCLYSGMNVA